MEHLPEPTADGESEPAAIHKPMQMEATEPIIALEPEPHNVSDRVCEPATPNMPKGVLVELEYKGMERSPTTLSPLRGSCNWPL